MIQRGIGEKIGEVWHTMAVLVIAYIICFTVGWEFTLCLIGAIPVLMVGAIIMAKSAQMGTKEEMKAYQQCAGMAE
jgi:ABC-type multidrug transport system fused ATPase/permease subunit